MRQLILRKIEGRFLEQAIPNKQGGLTPREQLKWNGNARGGGLSMAAKILTEIEDYDVDAQDLMDQVDDIRLAENLSDGERAEQMRAVQRALLDLERGVGQDTVTVTLESDEFQFVADVWWTLHFNADRKVGAIVNGISEAIDGAAEVTIRDGQVVVVEKGEQQNGHKNGKAANVRRLGKVAARR